MTRLAKEFEKKAEQNKKIAQKSEGMREVPIDDIMNKVHEKAFKK